MEMNEKKIRPGFRISYNDTEENNATAEEFKLFAKETTDDVYILAIKELLKTQTEDYKHQLLMNAYAEHEDRLNSLETAKEQPVKEKKTLKTFGDE